MADMSMSVEIGNQASEPVQDLVPMEKDKSAVRLDDDNDTMLAKDQGTTSPASQETNTDSMTDTTRNGVLGLRARRKDIEQKIDDLVEVGVQFLEHMKSQFVEKMERIKEDLDAFCHDRVGSLSQLSEETQASYSRLQSAQQLVESLGLQAIHQ